MISKETPIVLTIAGSEKRFTSEARLQEFLQKRREFWSQFDFGGLQSPFRSIESTIDQNTAYKNFWSDYQRHSDINRLRSDINLSFSRLPPHTESEAKIIEKIYQTEGREIAAGALLAMIGHETPLNMQNKVLIEGVFAFFLHKSGFTKMGLAPHRASLAEILAEQADEFEKHVAETEDLQSVLKSIRARADLAIENQASWTRESQAEFARNASALITDKISELERTEEAYLEAMKLDRPRAYWSEKGDGHRTKANKYRWRMFTSLSVSGLVAIAGLIVLFHVSIDLITSNPETEWPISLFLLLTGMGFVGVSVLFWINRLIIRLFLSELHLAMDAEERVTMIESYLALNTEIDFPAEQRELVLRTIFRPTQDGIVKDDAAADPNLAALLGRFKA